MLMLLIVYVALSVSFALEENAKNTLIPNQIGEGLISPPPQYEFHPTSSLSGHC